MGRTPASLVLLCVTACGPMPSVQATVATADSVTYQFPADQQGQATHQAMLYCANLGRSAVLRSVRPETAELTVAVYDCR